MIIQQVISLETEGLTPSIHSAVVGWLNEDPRGKEEARDIGYFETPAEAMLAGFRLLSSPTSLADDAWDWWLVRDVDVGPRGRMAITGGTPVRCLLLTASPFTDPHEDRWSIRTPPLRAVYNDYGSIENIHEAIERFRK